MGSGLAAGLVATLGVGLAALLPEDLVWHEAWQLGEQACPTSRHRGTSISNPRTKIGSDGIPRVGISHVWGGRGGVYHPLGAFSHSTHTARAQCQLLRCLSREQP